MLGKDSTAGLYVQTGPRGLEESRAVGLQVRLDRNLWVRLCLSAPPSPDPESPGLPQKCHVLLYIDGIAEDVAFQGRRGLLEPEK